MKFPKFYGTRRFITTFTSACQLSLSWARSIQFMPSHPTSRRFILIVSSHVFSLVIITYSEGNYELLNIKQIQSEKSVFQIHVPVTNFINYFCVILLCFILSALLKFIKYIKQPTNAFIGSLIYFMLVCYFVRIPNNTTMSQQIISFFGPRPVPGYQRRIQ